MEFLWCLANTTKNEIARRLFAEFTAILIPDPLPKDLIL